MPSNPSTLARLTGTFWGLTILAGFVTLGVGGRAAVYVNAFAGVTYLGASVFAAGLLKPVDRTLAGVTGILGVIGTLISLDQSFLDLLTVPRNAAFVFFGSQCTLLGYLIFKSTYIPAWVGALLSFGGLGWLTLGLSSLLASDFAQTLMPFILLPGVIGETTLTLRLLTGGVDTARWHEIASHPDN